MTVSVHCWGLHFIRVIVTLRLSALTLGATDRDCVQAALHSPNCGEATSHGDSAESRLTAAWLVATLSAPIHLTHTLLSEPGESASGLSVLYTRHFCFSLKLNGFEPSVKSVPIPFLSYRRRGKSPDRSAGEKPKRKCPGKETGSSHPRVGVFVNRSGPAERLKGNGINWYWVIIATCNEIL